MGNACAPADGVDEESAFAVRCTVSCTPSGRGGDDADDADDVMHFMPAPGADDAPAASRTSAPGARAAARAPPPAAAAAPVDAVVAANVAPIGLE